MLKYEIQLKQDLKIAAQDYNRTLHWRIMNYLEAIKIHHPELHKVRFSLQDDYISIKSTPEMTRVTSLRKAKLYERPMLNEEIPNDIRQRLDPLVQEAISMALRAQ